MAHIHLSIPYLEKHYTIHRRRHDGEWKEERPSSLVIHDVVRFGPTLTVAAEEFVVASIHTADGDTYLEFAPCVPGTAPTANPTSEDAASAPAKAERHCEPMGGLIDLSLYGARVSAAPVQPTRSILVPTFRGYFQTHDGAWPFKVDWFGVYSFAGLFVGDVYVTHTDFDDGWRTFVAEVEEAIKGHTSTWIPPPGAGFREWPLDANSPPPGVPFGPAEDPKPLSVREAARRRTPLGGADAQALEGALAQVERELEQAKRQAAAIAEHDRSLGGKLDLAARELAKRDEVILELQGELEAAKQQVHEGRRDILLLKQQRSVVAQELDEVRHHNEVLTDHNRRLGGELTHLNDRFDILSKKKDTLESALATVRQERDEARAQRDAAEHVDEVDYLVQDQGTRLLSGRLHAGDRHTVKRGREVYVVEYREGVVCFIRSAVAEYVNLTT